MKNKVILERKARAVDVVATAAIAAVMGLGGLALTNGAVNAVTTRPGSTTGSTSTGTGTGTTGTGTGTSTTLPDTSTTTPTDPTPTTPATTPDTGLFTADGEFASTEGAVTLLAILAILGGGAAALKLCGNMRHVSFDRK